MGLFSKPDDTSTKEQAVYGVSAAPDQRHGENVRGLHPQSRRERLIKAARHHTDQ